MERRGEVVRDENVPNRASSDRAGSDPALPDAALPDAALPDAAVSGRRATDVTAASDDVVRVRRGLSWSQEIVLLVGLALAITLIVRLFVVQAFYIPSGSMEPTLHVGDRVLVSKLSSRLGNLHRGDVIVFDGRGSFAPVDAGAGGDDVLSRIGRSVGAFLGVAPSERDFVKRVVGLPGDHVICCDAQGRVTVNDEALEEPYVYPGDAASAQPFDIVVPQGRLWVMGDHRSDSADSRAHLGDPGGGTVPLDRVIGKVFVRFWPPARLGGNDEMAAPTR